MWKCPTMPNWFWYSLWSPTNLSWTGIQQSKIKRHLEDYFSGVHWISLVMFYIITVFILCQLCGPQVMRYSWGSKALKLRRTLYETLDGRWDCRYWDLSSLKHSIQLCCILVVVLHIAYHCVIFISGVWLLLGEKHWFSRFGRAIVSLFLVEVRSIYSLHPFAISSTENRSDSGSPN